MSILTALAFVPLPRKTIADPVIQRRATFIKQLEQQRELAREPGFEPTKRKWVVNVDGCKQLVTVPKRVKRWCAWMHRAPAFWCCAMATGLSH